MNGENAAADDPETTGEECALDGRRIDGLYEACGYIGGRPTLARDTCGMVDSVG